MIFNPKEGGRLVLNVDEGSMVIDVKSARLAYQEASISSDSHHQTIIKLDCELIGTIVKKDTQGDKTEAIILQGEKDSPDAVVLETSHLTAVNVVTNFPGSTGITIEAYGLPIEYSKMVEKALQDKPKPVGPGNTSMGVIHRSMLGGSGYSSPLGNLVAVPVHHSQWQQGGSIKGGLIQGNQKSLKVWPGVSITDQEILEALDDQED